MKKTTLVSSIILLLTTLSTFSQETFKRVSISNINKTTISKLHHLGVDMTCGVSIVDNSMTVEVAEHQLHEMEHEGISYSVLIDDMTKFYSERAIKNLPLAAAEVEREKILKRSASLTGRKTGKSLTIKELINNIGQYDECEEIDWPIPDNWNLNDANSYPNETNHFGGCLTFDMVVQELDDMKRLYPNLISAKKNASPTNQLTVEGRTVWMVRISDNPEIDEPTEPETLYQSLIHSREAATVMNQLYFMWYLLENYDSDPAIRNLVNNHALYFVPVFNPDGFVYNETIAPNGGGGQRKNRNTSGGCGTYDDGIDLNRNSAYYWGNGGASITNTCSATYAGTGPFSENETQIMRDFFYEHDFKLALNHHSYKNAMLHAYAGTAIENPRPDEYSKYNHDMTFYNRYAHGPSTSISGLNSGNMNDWMLGGPAGVSSESGTPTGIGSGKHTLAWTPENGLFSEGAGGPGGTYSGFWPNPLNYLPIAKRAMRMNFLAAYFSGKYAKLHDLNQADITNTSGNLTFGIENLGQNGNDLTPETNSFTVTVSAITPNVTINTPSASQNFTASEILAQKTVDISYTLDPGISANDEIQFRVTLTNDYASDNVLYEVNITKIYNPNLISTLDATNFSNWTSSGSWASVTDGYNDASAIRSNATIPYSANQNRTLQYDGTLNFSGVQSAIIQFYAKWDLERSYDYVVIEASSDGSSWTELCGKHTKPGAPTANNSYSSTDDAGDSTFKSSTDDARQNGITALYDGDTQDKWSMEEIVIDASTNSAFLGDNSVLIRFRLRTDSSNRKDSYKNADFEGFTFDDFKVIAMGCSTSVPTNIIASNETTNAATLDWDEVFNNSYDLRYRVNGTSTWTNVNDFEGNTRKLTGLTAGTIYDVQVRSQCGTGTNSAYSTTYNLTTLACNSPSNILASDIGLSTVRIHWDEIPDATYDVRYRINGSSTWTSTSSTSLVLDQPVYNISGLSEATQYEVQVRTDCPGSGNSSYSSSTLFTTLGCSAPNNIMASDVFINSANIVWDALNPATYDLRYRENGTSTWTNISNLGDSAYNASNLDPNTTYDVQVRTDCSSSTSAYSATVNFTTLACSVPTSVTADDITSSGATVNWDEIIGSDFDLRYRETGTSTWTNLNDRALNFYNIPNLTNSTEYEVQVRTVCSTSINSAYTASTVFTTLDCTTSITSFPYSENFDSGIGNWEQATGDDGSWTLNSAGTGSGGTGPTDDVTGGGNYFYVEASLNQDPGPESTVNLESPCIDLTGYENAVFSFYYHMHGSDMGDLRLDISVDGGTNWTTLSTLSGEQQANQTDPWLQANINLTFYNNQVIKLRFSGTTPLDTSGGVPADAPFRSDMAIDDIEITADVISSTTWYADSDNDGFGDPSISQTSGSQPSGYVADNTDCDDTDDNEFPGQTWYIDADGDDYGASSSVACERPTNGFLLSELSGNGTDDCNDNDDTINTPQQYYVDNDGDGFGSTTTAMLCASSAPAGYADNNTDCNDNDDTVNAPQQYYVDNDGDGFGSTTTAMLCASSAPAGYADNNTDCDDTDDTIYPGAPEITNDGIDQDCDGFDQNTLERDKLEFQNISLAPNPFSDSINIGLPSSYGFIELNVKIFDMNGRIVLNQEYSSSNSKISVGGLDKLDQAPYVIKITNTDTGFSMLKQLIKF